MALIFGVLAELNAKNQTVPRPQPSPSAVVPQNPLVETGGIQSSSSAEEDDSCLDDKAIDRSFSVIPDSLPPIHLSNQEANAGGHGELLSIQGSTEKLATLQMRLGFENDPRAYYDFRVYHPSFKLTLDLVAYAYG